MGCDFVPGRDLYDNYDIRVSCAMVIIIDLYKFTFWIGGVMQYIMTKRHKNKQLLQADILIKLYIKSDLKGHAYSWH